MAAVVSFTFLLSGVFYYKSRSGMKKPLRVIRWHFSVGQGFPVSISSLLSLVNSLSMALPISFKSLVL